MVTDKRLWKYLLSTGSLLILLQQDRKGHLVSAGKRWEFWLLAWSPLTLWHGTGGGLFPSGRDEIPSFPLGLLWHCLRWGGRASFSILDFAGGSNSHSYFCVVWLEWSSYCLKMVSLARLAFSFLGSLGRDSRLSLRQTRKGLHMLAFLGCRFYIIQSDVGGKKKTQGTHCVSFLGSWGS